MRILLDESLPRKLKLELAGHEAHTVQTQGWAGLENGALLRAASQEFQVFVTGDQNLEFQPESEDIADRRGCHDCRRQPH